MSAIGGAGGLQPPSIEGPGPAHEAAEAAPTHAPAPAAPTSAGPSTFERAPTGAGLDVSASARAVDHHGLPAPHLEAAGHAGWASGAPGAARLAGPALEALVERLEEAIDVGADLAQVFAAALAEGLPAEVVALIEGSLGGLMQPDAREALVAALAPLAEAGEAHGAAAGGKPADGAREAGAARDAAPAKGAAPAATPGAASAAKAGVTAAPDPKDVAAALGDAARAIASGVAKPAVAAMALRSLDRLIERDPASATGVIQIVVSAGGGTGAGGATEGEAGGDGAGGGGAGAGQGGLDAIRSLDHAGAKAIALDRASLRMADLRRRLRGDPEAAADLERTRASAAALLASAPVAIAGFARTRPELLPPSSTQRVMAEILRGGGPEVDASLEATFAAALAQAPPNKAGARAFALGYLGGAAIAAVEELADPRAARRLAAILSPEGPAESALERCRGALAEAVRTAPRAAQAVFEEGFEIFAPFRQ